LLKGVNYVGIGVSDIDKSLKFYGDLLGFTEVMFDYTGSLPGMEKVKDKPETKARVVMLKNQNIGPLGLGMIELIQLLPPAKPEPCVVAIDRLWGDVGLAEVAFNTRNSAKVFEMLLEKGVKAVVTPGGGLFHPTNIEVGYAYMRDIDDTLIEFVDGYACRSIGEDTRIEGVNHVGFGVSDIEKSLRFYRELGFTELVLEYRGRLAAMATLFPITPPEIRCPMLANYYGATLEIIQLQPPAKPTPYRESWGHLGVTEFGIEVSNLEKAYEELQQKGMKFLCTPQTVKVSSGEWKYACIVEPDRLHVAIVEPRY